MVEGEPAGDNVQRSVRRTASDRRHRRAIRRCRARAAARSRAPVLAWPGCVEFDDVPDALRQGARHRPAPHVRSIAVSSGCGFAASTTSVTISSAWSSGAAAKPTACRRNWSCIARSCASVSGGHWLFRSRTGKRLCAGFRPVSKSNVSQIVIMLEGYGLKGVCQHGHTAGQ